MRCNLPGRCTALLYWFCGCLTSLPRRFRRGEDFEGAGAAAVARQVGYAVVEADVVIADNLAYSLYRMTGLEIAVGLPDSMP